MRGLTKIPSEQELVSIYNLIEAGRLDLDTFISFYEWTRFDPRLGELLTRWLTENWFRLNPFRIHLKLRRSTWPSVMGVLLDSVSLNIVGRKRKAFGVWKKCATADLIPASNELFFIGLYALGGTEAEKQVLQSSKIYRRWGYFGFETFQSKSIKKILHEGQPAKPVDSIRCVFRMMWQRRLFAEAEHVPSRSPTDIAIRMHDV